VSSLIDVDLFCCKTDASADSGAEYLHLLRVRAPPPVRRPGSGCAEL